MARFVRKRWTNDVFSGVPRADRRSYDYEAYIPDPLTGRPYTLDGGVAADVADAEGALARFDAKVTALSDTEALARLLLQAEAVASSRIEGLESADEVLGNIDAMQEALSLAEAEGRITVATVLAIHRRLLESTRLSEHAGRLREVQNWIGGSSYNPCSAVFVPPPPEAVLGLLEDLCEFCNDESLPAVVQAAVAHAQFETIHPFVDGNGRTGRALIHLILRRRGLATRAVPPVSLVLATYAGGYVDALTSFRYRGRADAALVREGLNRWVGVFAVACIRAVEDSSAFEKRCHEIESSWREHLGRVRAGSSVDLLLKLLPGTPIVTVKSAALMLGRSPNQVNEAVGRLEEAGILKKITVGRRNRAFEASNVIEAFADLERQLASPRGDTQISPPARPVPRGRKRD